MTAQIPDSFLDGFQSEGSKGLLCALKRLCFMHPSAVVITDKDNKIVEVNPSYEEMTGYGRAEAIGQKPSIGKSEKHAPEFYKRMWAQIIDQRHWEGEIWDRRKDGTVYPKWLSIDRIADEVGETLFYMAVFHGLNERGDSDEVVDKLLYYDQLTGLPNRVLFRHHLEHEFQVSDRYNRKAGLMLINIDRFSQVNDGFGYLAGDDLIVEVAKRLEVCVRQTDLVAKSSDQEERSSDSLSRFGGDAFSFILSDLLKGESASIVANRVVHAFEAPFDVNGEKIYLNASMGIAIYPENGSTTSELLRCAENALTRSKRNGGNEYTFFSDAMNQNTAARMRLEGSLRNAIKADEFEVHYQPKVSIKGASLRGMEALIRWPQPDGSIMPPAEFIPLSEDAGLIVPIGAWVLKQACDDILALNLNYGRYLKVAVNISPKQFRQRDFLQSIRDIVAESGIDPTFLELEITESMVMENVDGAIETMKEIRDIGISLSMDDFGTGYSSLAYLRKFPINALKIDRSFVCGMMDSSADASIVSAICSIGRNLGLEVIAEGVENEFEIPLLQEMGCTLIQGYYYGKPTPLDDFKKKFLDPQI